MLSTKWEYFSASITEIAEDFNVNNHYVSVKLSRIRDKLKKRLMEEGFKLWKEK